MLSLLFCVALRTAYVVLAHTCNPISYRSSFIDDVIIPLYGWTVQLEPGKDFHYQSEGVDIRITYNTQHTVPGAMNLHINGTECNIQTGKFVRYRNHGLVVDVVNVRQHGMDINQSQEVAGKGCQNTTSIRNF